MACQLEAHWMRIIQCMDLDGWILGTFKPIINCPALQTKPKSRMLRHLNKPWQRLLGQQQQFKWFLTRILTSVDNNIQYI